MGKLKTTAQFVAEAEGVHGGRYDYSNVDYTNSKKDVLIICRVHGAFKQKPYTHLVCGGCPKCAGRNKTTEEFIEESKEVHGDKYDYLSTTYLGSSHKVTIICRDHGIFVQTPTGHLAGRGCPKCSGIGKTTAQFISEASIIHANRYRYDKLKYVDSKSKVNIVCNIHGIFKQMPSNHLNGRGCPRCAKHGFNRTRKSILYVYTFNDFVGFGITNNFEQRNKQHTNTFTKRGIESVLVNTYEMSGEKAIKLEAHLKCSLDIVDSGIEGFRTEAVHILNLSKLSLMIANFIDH